MIYILSGVTIAHGLIHLLGFIKAFKLIPIARLSKDISKIHGVFWLLAAVLFLLSAILLLAGQTGWFIPCAAAIIVSQVLIVGAWSDAKYGTIANVIVLAAIAAGF